MKGSDTIVEPRAVLTRSYLHAMGRAEELRDRLRTEGEAAIDRFIAEREAEGQWLDFKNASPAKDGRWDPRGHDEDNLGEAVAGFANTDGGIIVWGVDARATKKDPGDVARSRPGIADPTGFVGWLQGVTSRAVVPHVRGVDHFVVPSAVGRGFAVTYVPASAVLPHRDERSRQYVMRSGSSFVVIPHIVLASMFGTRPVPELDAVVALGNYDRGEDGSATIDLNVSVYNAGSTMAPAPYVSCWVWDAPELPSSPHFSRILTGPDVRSTSVAIQPSGPLTFTLVADSTYAVAPSQLFPLLTVSFRLVFPVKSGIRLEGTLGATGTQPARFKLVVPIELLSRLDFRELTDDEGIDASGRVFVASLILEQAELVGARWHHRHSSLCAADGPTLERFIERLMEMHPELRDLSTRTSPPSPRPQ